MHNSQQIEFFVYNKTTPTRAIIGGIIVLCLFVIFMKEMLQHDSWGIFGSFCLSALLGPIGILLISLDAKRARLRNEDYSDWVLKNHDLHTGKYGTKHRGKLNYQSRGMRDKVPVEVLCVERNFTDEKSGKIMTACSLAVTKM